MKRWAPAVPVLPVSWLSATPSASASGTYTKTT